MSDDSSTVPAQLDTVISRLDDGDRRFARIEQNQALSAERMTRVEESLSTQGKSLTENTQATQQIASDTGDLVEFTKTMQSFAKLVVWIGKAAKPVTAIILFGIAAWQGWKALS